MIEIEPRLIKSKIYQVFKEKAFQEGDSVVFEADEHGVHLRPARPTSVFARYAGIWREGEGLTVEEINAQIHEMRGHDE
jgi:hypothetical protein